MPLGTSGCARWFQFAEINCLHCLFQAARGKKLFLGENGTVDPTLTRAVSAPWCPYQAERAEKQLTLRNE